MTNDEAVPAELGLALEWARQWPAESISRLRRTANTDLRGAGRVSETAANPYDVTPRPMGCVHIVGAGPVGLFLAALLQSIEGQRVRLYERRAEYTRTRMVMLAPYLVADSIETYQADVLDGPNVAAIFDPTELETRLAYRRTVAGDLRALLKEWTLGFVALKTIEQSLADLIERRATGTVERVDGEVTRDDVLEQLEPGDIVVDTTGTRSLFRDALVPGGDGPDHPNLMRVRLEYALVVTFLYSQHYECNELCKYAKNVGNTAYKFIPGYSARSTTGRSAT